MFVFVETVILQEIDEGNKMTYLSVVAKMEREHEA